MLREALGRRGGGAEDFGGASGRLFDEVLCLEQMLTTGGGWQDQVGGLTGGVKLVTTQPGLPQRITCSPASRAGCGRGVWPAPAAGVHWAAAAGEEPAPRHHEPLDGPRPGDGSFLGEIARLALAMRDALTAGDLDVSARCWRSTGR